MNTIRLILTAAVLALFGLPAISAADANRATIHAILVIASNERGPTDPKLAPYEANLKRTLRYESFRFAGEGSAAVAPGGTAVVTLPNNNRLEVQAERGDGRGARVKVRYGGTDVAIPSGKTVILAGRPAGQAGEISAVIVTAE
jgi:hypothetical protein